MIAPGQVVRGAAPDAKPMQARLDRPAQLVKVAPSLRILTPPRKALFSSSLAVLVAGSRPQRSEDAACNMTAAQFA